MKGSELKLDFFYERKINYYETDKMGIVHHSNYIRFLEEARCAFLDYIGAPYSTLENLGIMIPVLGVNISYKYHVSFDDTIKIKVSIKNYNGIKMFVDYLITDTKNGNIVLTGETKHCFTNSSLKPINLKKHFPDISEKFSKCIDID